MIRPIKAIITRTDARGALMSVEKFRCLFISEASRSRDDDKRAGLVGKWTT